MSESSTTDQRVIYAREFLAGARRRKVADMPPSILMREDAELRRVLSQVLDVVADYENTEVDENVTQILDSGDAHVAPADVLVLHAALDDAIAWCQDNASCDDCETSPEGLCETPRNSAGPGADLPGAGPRAGRRGSRAVSETYTARAVAVVARAARAEHDFAGWLAAVLSAVAGQLGSSDALTAGRPGSWEASLVDQLVKGTVGDSNEHLPRPGGRRRLTDAKVRQIRGAADWGEMTQQEIAAEFGVSPSTVSDIVNAKTWGWLR